MMRLKSFPIFALPLILLSACSLTADVTPPPDYQPTSIMAASPTGESAQRSPLVETRQPTVAGNAGTAVAATSQPIGKITGMITNGSGGGVPSDLQVTLFGYDNMTQVVELTAAVQPDDSFIFPDVEIPSGRVFFTQVTVGSVTFSSEVAHYSDTESDLSLPITIYDASTDASALTADRLHIFLDFSASGVIHLAELYVISNPTQTVITGKTAEDPVLTFDLPSGAADLVFQDGSIGDRYVQTTKGFGDRQPVFPGSEQHQVLFAYTMPYDQSLDLELPVSLPVKAAVVMIQDASVKLKSAQLTAAGSRDIQGMSFRVYNSADLAVGKTLNLTLTGKPTLTGSTDETHRANTNLFIGLGSFAAVLVVAGIVLVRSRKAARPKKDGKEVTQDVESQADPDDVDSLLDDITALDDLYYVGKLPKEAYQQRRAELKNKLAKLI
jgi:hypothetical protein